MKTSDDLFQLIRTLTKSEKRYFRIAAQSQGADDSSNYMKLFHAIEKMLLYNENKIKKIFAGTALVRHLPSEKNYLYSLLVKTLVKYHSSSDDEIALDELLHASEILYHKGLYSQSGKALEKALAFTLEKELYSRMFKISEIKINLVIHTASSTEEMKNDFNRSLESLNNAFEKLENNFQYTQLYAEFFTLIRKEGETIRTSEELLRFEKIMNHPLMKNESLAATKSSKRMFYFMHAAYNYIAGNMKQAYRYATKELAEIETDKKNMTGLSVLSSTRVSNLCEICLRMQEYDLCKQYLDKLKNSKVESPMEEARLFYRYNDLLLRLHTQTQEFEKAKELLATVETGLETYKANIHKSRAISIRYHIAYIYFGNGNMKSALKWINSLLDEKTDLRSDILCYARMLNCIIHYELNNYMLLESVFRGAQYFFTKREKMYKVESVFLKYFRKICNLPEPSSAQKIFPGFRDELKRLMNDPMEKKALEYFNLLAWVESKITG